MAKSPKIYWFSFSPGEMVTWSLDLGRPNGKGLFHAKFSSSGSPTGNTYPDNGLIEGRSPDLIYGEYLPAEYQTKLRNPIPVHNNDASKRGRLPADINVMGDGYFSKHPLVSERLKSAIEKLEPGKHQIIPASFVNAGLDPPTPVWTQTPWYYCNLLNWCEADAFMNVEQMADAIQRKNRPDGRGLLNFGSSNEKRYVVRRSFLEEHSGNDLFVLSSYLKTDLTHVLIAASFYCTDKARRHFKAAGLKGGHFYELPIA